MKTEFLEKIKNLNIEELVKKMLPYSKDFEVSYKCFFKKGIAGWPTWFIVIYRGEIFDDYLLFTICEHSEYTRTKYLKEKFDIDHFINDMDLAAREKKLYTFFRKNIFIEEDHFLHINDMKRLYDYLSEHNIILFEPTE